MIYAIISDIHSNAEALNEVLKFIETKGADRIISLGDIAGYGPDPDYCIETVRKTAYSNIIGNHDQAMYDDALKERFNRWAHIAITYQQKNIREDNKEWLKNLSFIDCPDPLFKTTHSTFIEPGRYMYTCSENDAKIDLDSLTTWVGFFGHTHCAAIYTQETNERGCPVESVPPKEGVFCKLKKGCRYLINPGSVGQPRDGGPEASFVMFNADEPGFIFYRIPYDYRLTMKKIKDAALPAFLAERLACGR